ncbi:uncharacterized protein LOC141639250 [Silene latifolia]|uniref:uncharacterized protein LOC141639250 n=1 Tax=Silene latifolia TaxID=37657 RepID=UPI003D76A81D
MNWNKVSSSLYEDWSVFTNSSCHKGGRVWLIWDPGMFMVTIQEITAQCIHAHILDRGRNITFWVTMIYGLNKPTERESLWHRIRKYHHNTKGPWITCGDFNALLVVDERIGGAPVTLADISPLKQLVVQDCELYELKGCWSFYTWTNKHETEGKVYSRIDRVFTNEDWLNVFPGSYANFLPEGLFDHCPCLISFEEILNPRKIPFKYFNMWDRATDFMEIVQNSWGPEVRGTAIFTVVTKLKRLKKVNDPFNEGLCHAESECAKEVRWLHQARTEYLQQKAKLSWAQDGDENSAFIHASIKKRRRKNKVFQIVKIGQCLTEHHCEVLMEPVTSEEIRRAVFSIPGTKAPGPDGYNNDLILFCKGERVSIKLVLQDFNYFSKASGLKMNKGKSNYYCNGMDDWLDSRYGAKHLSYAGRLVLIRAVLSTLHNYWALIFILPKTLLKKIESIGKDYLWHGKTDSVSPALVAWERVCRPKRQGGWGLHNLMVWNMVVVAKYVWWIEIKADHLWVKWIHAIYIKNRQWKDYEPTINSSWAWRNICQIKTIFKDLVMPSSVCIAKGTHLFFKCVYSRRCCKLVSDWCAEPLLDKDCINWWCRKRYTNLSKKKTAGVILAEKLVQLVKQDVRNRLKKFQIKCKSVSVWNWIETIVKS